MTVAEIIEQAKSLSQQQRKELVKILVDSLGDDETESALQKHSILELAGLGAEIWDGVDAQEYVNRLRDE